MRRMNGRSVSRDAAETAGRFPLDRARMTPWEVALAHNNFEACKVSRAAKGACKITQN